MGKLSDLHNIGLELERQLIDVGITTKEELIDCGSEEAWLKIKQKDPSACINRLMALEGAIQNIRWHNLPDKDKQRLKEFYERNKINNE